MKGRDRMGPIMIWCVEDWNRPESEKKMRMKVLEGNNEGRNSVKFFFLCSVPINALVGVAMTIKFQ
jgi:hypothetical protein